MNTLNDSPSNEELAWAAGFLDGEGHFGFQVNKSKNCDRGSLVVEARQARREPLDKLASIFGGNVTGPYKNDGLGYYSWHTTAADRVQSIVSSIWPWLTEPKREQAEEALEKFNNRRPSMVEEVTAEVFQERRSKVSKPLSKTCKNGHERTPETLYINPSGTPGCKICRRLSRQKWWAKKGQNE